MMQKTDPRTRLVLGTLAIFAAFAAKRPETILIQFGLVCIGFLLLKMTNRWRHFAGLALPMAVMVFLVSWASLGLHEAFFMTVRLVNLLAASLLFFQNLDPDELGGALRKMRVPFGFVFILTTALRFVPQMGRRIRGIRDAQVCRGMDMRIRLKNIGNFFALLNPLLVQSFILADELAVAMECRGFGRKGRSMRKSYCIRSWEYVVMMAAGMGCAAFVFWEWR